MGGGGGQRRVADVPQLEVRVGRRQRLLGVGARASNAGCSPRRRQHRPLGERVRLLAAEEHQRGLPSLDARVVGLHQHASTRPPAGPRHGARAAAVIGEPLRTNRSRADRRFDHHLARGQVDRLPRREELARQDRHAGDGQVEQVALVGVPRHHVRRVEQVRHRAWSRPGTRRAARCSPTSRAGSPGRRSSVSGSSHDSQRACRPRLRSAATSPSSSPSPSTSLRATGQHDAGMEDVGTGQLHADITSRMIVTMHAIEVAETGGPEVLTYVEKPQPDPGPGQVLIKAEAIGVNFIDTYFRSGLYPREVPFVVGTEVCGTVAAVGDDVAALNVGDRVVTRQGRRRIRRILRCPSRFRRLRARRGGLRRGRIRTAEGHDRALPDQVGVPGAAGRHRAGARRRGRRRADPDAVGHQHRHAR